MYAYVVVCVYIYVVWLSVCISPPPSDLGGHILDLYELPSWVDVADLDESSRGGTGDVLLLLLVEAWPLGDRLGHGDSPARPLLPRRSHRDVQPGRGARVDHEKSCVKH